MKSQSESVLKKQVKSSIEDFLVYDPADARICKLFEPGAVWKNASEYPPVKPLVEYSKDDYLRLAWEILRRMPRYRRQVTKIRELGIEKASFAKYQDDTFFTDTKLPDFAGWKDVPLKGHKCIPRISHQDETFGEYVEARGDYEDWFVMNRRKWVLDLWGLSYLESPSTLFKNQKKVGIFKRPILTLEDHDLGRPRLVTTFVKQNEVVFKMRIDSPLDLQIEIVKSEFHAARKRALQEERDVFDPLGLPRKKQPSKVFAISKESAKAEDRRIRPDFNERGGRVLLKQIEFSPMWLRVWDAVQEARVEKKDQYFNRDRKIRWPSIDRKALIAKFDDDYLNPKSMYLNEHPNNKRSRDGDDREAQSLRSALHKTLSSDPIDNWRRRIEKYIEGGDDAYRQLIAIAFSKNLEG
jgi:hypothetical protein